MFSFFTISTILMLSLFTKQQKIIHRCHCLIPTNKPPLYSAILTPFCLHMVQTKAAQHGHQVSEPAEDNGYLEGRTKKSAPAGSSFEGSNRSFFLERATTRFLQQQSENNCTVINFSPPTGITRYLFYQQQCSPLFAIPVLPYLHINKVRLPLVCWDYQGILIYSILSSFISQLLFLICYLCGKGFVLLFYLFNILPQYSTELVSLPIVLLASQNIYFYFLSLFIG